MTLGMLTCRRLPERCRRLVAACAALVTISCGDSGGARFEIAALAQGTPARDVAIDGASLRLTRADIAFGPLYLCATESAESELCGTALAELLSTEVVDGLSSESQGLGTLDATSGTVRSGFFDYGITWGLAQQGPRASPGGIESSARLEGRVMRADGKSYRFRVEIKVRPLSAGDAAVNGFKTRQELERNVGKLTVIFDPNAWLKRVRLEPLLEMADGRGEIVVAAGTQPYEAILQGMTINDLPRLRWQ